MPVLPTGTVTFLLTDVEGSTRLWAADPLTAAEVTRQVYNVIDECVRRHGGVRPVEQGEGDSTVSAFTTAAAAVAAALQIQLGLVDAGLPVRVRMAVHTGTAELRDPGNYMGASVIRCARIRELAQGGDVLLSASTAALVADAMPVDSVLVDLGEHVLRDLTRPEHVWRLTHPRLPEPGPLRTPTAGERTNLRPMVTDLVGRERELGEISSLLGEARLLTLTGSGGVGKTRLAHAAATQVFAAGTSSVWWVDLAKIADDGTVAAEVAAAMQVPSSPTETTTESLVSWVHERETLMVLDNCEHVIDAVATLSDALVSSRAKVTVLATSREPLGVPGEVTWRTPSLRLPESPVGPLAEARQFESVELLCRRAEAARPGIAFEERDVRVLVDICTRLDGLPLAIELAAARLRTMSLTGLATSLDERFRTLGGGARTALPRQRTLEACVAWSYDLLDDRSRALFRRLAVFATWFTTEPVMGICSGDEIGETEVVELLTGLVDRSLVEYTGDRYRLLETLRDFARVQAVSSGELATWRDRHLAWCVRHGTPYRVGATLDAASFATGVAMLPEFRAALDWSLAPGNDPALALVPTIATLHDWSARHDENRALGAALRERFDDDDPRRIDAIAALVNTPYYAGDLATLEAQADALASAEGLQRARLLIGTSEPCLFDGDPDGEARMGEAIELAAEAGSLDDETDARLSMSHFLSVSGRLREARPVVDLLERRCGASDGPFAAGVQTARGLIVIESSIAAAARLFRDSSRRLGGHPSPRSGLVVCALWALDPELAAEALGRDGWADVGGAYGPIGGLARAVPDIVAGDLEQARAVLAASTVGWTMGNVATWIRLLEADLAARTGDHAAARSMVDEAARAIDGKNLPYLRSLVHLARAGFALAEGEPRFALGLAHEGLVEGLANESNLIVMESLEMVAIANHALGRSDTATVLLTATDAHRSRTGHRWRWGSVRDSCPPILAAAEPGVGADASTVLGLDEAAALATRTRGERGRAAHGWDALTPTEVEVSRLAVAGSTNKEIAAQLYMGVATVKTHLIHIYGKLGVRSRTQLAALAANRPSNPIDKPHRADGESGR